jgi:dihydrodipicolinate synthase/N-acetylneuraminate lyase
VIPALVTPFHPDGGVNIDVVPSLVQYQIAAGVSGFYVCGNTGEGFVCTVDERKTMLEAVVKANGGKVPIMVHVGACPVSDAVALAQHAKEARATVDAQLLCLWKPSLSSACAGCQRIPVKGRLRIRGSRAVSAPRIVKYFA